jgi:hypothetical protein
VDHRQAALMRVTGIPPRTQVSIEVDAVLVAETGNPADPDAVGVWIGGELIGYVRRLDVAWLRPAILRLQTRTGARVALPALVSGTSQYPLSVRLQFDGAALGVPEHGRSRFHDVGLGYYLFADGDWPRQDLWEGLPPRPGKAVREPAVRQVLATRQEPELRHFAFAALEAALYFRRRDPSGLAEFDAVCGQHHGEMPTIRPVLLERLNAVPQVTLYRQAAIRWAAAGDFAVSSLWATRGLEFYGNAPEREGDIADLLKRLLA